MPSTAFRSLVAMLALAATPAVAELPAFLTGPQAGAPHDLAMGYLHAHAADHGLSFSDLADLEVTDQYPTKHNGTTHIYLRQRHQGIPVFNGTININVARDGSIINFNNRFVSDLAGKVNTVAAAITPEQAVRATASHLGIAAADSLVELETAGGPTRATKFAPSGISRDEIPASLMFLPTEKNGVRLVWRTVVRDPRSADWWEVRVDAVAGQVIEKNNWTDHADKAALGGPCYNVVPFPGADPNDAGGDTVTVCDPADPVASDFGWHDNNGVAGSEFTDTRGNNVHARDDLANDDEGTLGQTVDGGVNLLFEPDWDPALDPEDGDNLDASIVNLFYYNNIMHDVSYHYGFDEDGGNFQTHNYGAALGDPNDHVLADALDGSGTNNANFGTPPDGTSPRMQMFRWTYPFPNEVVIDAPGGIAGAYQASSAAFGPLVNTTGITGNIVLAIDGVGPDVNDGCEAITNGAALTGNIALINRGTCNFTVKVKNAQLVGATAALIKKITPGGPSALGGTDATVTIPSGMISLADGNLIVAQGGGVHGTFRSLAVQPEPDRDSDLDNGIIAHEYGHGISNRLVGGPDNTSCFFGTERMGEGLSDFWTVVLSPLASDTASTARGVGTYVIFEGRNGLGIRNAPYSTSLTVNAQTFANIDDGGAVTVPHGVGSIWMTMAYEVYQELIARHGLDLDLYEGDGGNNVFIQLIVDGMKLVGCGPTFVSLRNAILLADVNNNGGDNECEIWRGFAKRGLGVAAQSGTTDVGNEVQDFTIPVQCRATPNYVFDDGFETGSTSRWTSTSP